ncbi:MAG: hypothetical protein AAF512_15305 [Pseudomonadota bacterium]
MPTRVRNSVARSALLRKGGVHEKSRSSKRMHDKKALKSEVKNLRNGKED